MAPFLAVALSLTAAVTQEAQPSTAPGVDSKLLAVIEQNKAAFERCMADVDRQFPAKEDPKVEKEKQKLEAKQNKSIKDLERLRDIAMKGASDLLGRINGQEACESQLDALAKTKLAEAGADEATTKAALLEWKAGWRAKHP